MATTTIAKSIPVPKKRAEALAVMVRTIINARTPLSIGIFHEERIDPDREDCH